MKWHQHYCLFKELGELHGYAKYAKDDMDLCKQLAANYTGKKFGADGMEAVLKTEAKWIADGRPYYDLYPSCVEAFCKVNLSKVTCDSIELPIPRLMIRFAEGHEAVCKSGKITTIFAARCRDSRSDGRGLMIAVYHGMVENYRRGKIHIPVVGLTPLQPGVPLDAVPGYSENDTVLDYSMAALRVVTTICLLRGNPDIIQPEPLRDDQAKYEAAVDEATRQRLLDKAKRRGKVAFSVGKHVVAAPGFRCPHFAVRWMGHGEPKTPVVRPIKGCIVMRKQIEEVPTGYLDDLPQS